MGYRVLKTGPTGPSRGKKRREAASLAASFFVDFELPLDDRPHLPPRRLTMQTEALLKVAWVLGGALFGAALGTMVAPSPDETQLRYMLALLFALTVWRRVR